MNPGSQLPETEIKPTKDASANNPFISSGISLILGSLASSVLICSYVIAIGMINLPKSDVDPLGRAAEIAAEELMNVTIEHPTFGRIGLCDVQEGEEENATRTTGINTLMARLRHAAMVASMIDNKSLLSLANTDLKTLKQLREDLKVKLEKSLEVRGKQGEPNAIREGTLPLRDRIQKILESAYRTELTLTEVKLSLGRVNSTTLTTTRITAPTAESKASFVGDGRYKAYARVPVPGSDDPIVFYPEGDGVESLPASEFNPVELTTTPSAVLVEAVYEPKDASKGKQPKIKSACALVGPKSIPIYATALAIRFPNCIPSQFKRPLDLLAFPNWKGIGNWQQAVGASVPGDGRLGPALDPVSSMNAGKAIELTFYQWLRQLDASTDPEKIASLFKQPWTEAERVASAVPLDTNIVANSCLVQDTGAREFAILHQTSQGEYGQEALSRSFFIGNKKDIPPPSSIPLLVDGAGNCNLCGRIGFDKRLIEDFLEAVYDTNLAAIESRSIANQVQRRSARVLHLVEQQLFVKKQELKSIDEAIRRITPEDHLSKELPADIENKLLPFRDKRRLLSEVVERVQKQRDEMLFVGQLAKLASHNAEQAALASFDICAKANTMLRDGLYRIDRQGNAFLLGGRTVFSPQIRPVLESEFHEAALHKGSTNENWRSPWLRKGFSVLGDIHTLFPDEASISIEGKKLSSILTETDSLPRAAQATIVLDSRLGLSNASHRPKLYDYERYPFGDMPIPAGRLLYFSKGAFTTGNQPEVSWSVLIRNMIDIKNSRAERGQPVPVRDWCNQSEPGGCPDLAAEIQIRTPLPVVKDLPPGAIISNPTSGLRAPQIPPLPPEML